MDVTVERLSYAEQMKLAETVAYAGQSQKAWLQAVTVASVKAIDGRETMGISHAAHIRAVLKELGDEGYAKAFAEVWKPVEAPPADVTIKPLSTLEQWDLAEMAGTLFDIPAWSGLALMACIVRTFNGQTLDFPKDKKELRARVRLLGWPGMEAAGAALKQAGNAAEADEDE
jgi:hypothetical protein